MEPAQLQRAIMVATATAAELDLPVDDAVVIYNSDRIAVRLMPGDLLARVGPLAHQTDFQIEVEAAHRLAATDSPVGLLAPGVKPRVVVRDGFVISLWTYYAPVEPATITPADYAQALRQLHAGLRQIELPVLRFTDHVAGRQRLVADPALTPELAAADREFISTSLSRLIAAITSTAAREQLLHGEPHTGNVLNTVHGPLFIDLATCCRGPLEYDLAFVPPEVRAHYPGVNQALVQQCHALMWAMFAAQRWTRDDQMPDRAHWRTEGLTLLRTALHHAGMS